MIDDAQLARHLLSQGTATQEQLQRGLQLRNITGQPLYHILIENALCREEDIVDAAAHLLSQPCVHLHNFKFDDAVTGLISSSMATRNGVLPLAIEPQEDQSDRLILAMIDPIDIMAMDEISSHTGMDIHPVLAGPKDLRAAIERAYDQASAELADLDDPFASLGPLPQIDSPAQDDSWADFFDQAQDNPIREESADISREMRNRPSSGPFDALPQEARNPVKDDSEPILDLGDWELSQADADEPEPDIDYAALGKDLKEAKKPTQDPFGMFFVEDEKDAEKFSGTFIASPSRSFGGISDVSVAKEEASDADAPELTGQIEDEDIDDILLLSEEELTDMPAAPSAPSVPSKKLTSALLEDSEVQEDPEEEDEPPLQTQIASMKFSLSGLASISPKKGGSTREDKLSKLSQKLQASPQDQAPQEAASDNQQLGTLNSSFAESFAQELADNLDQAMEPAQEDKPEHVRPQMLTPPGTLGRLQIKKIPAAQGPLQTPIVERNSHLDLQEKPAQDAPAPEIIDGELAFESSEYDLIEPHAEPPAIESDILAAFMAPSEPEHIPEPATDQANQEEIEQLAEMIRDASNMGIAHSERSGAKDLPQTKSEHARHEQATAANPALTVEYVRRMAAAMPPQEHTTRPGPPLGQETLPAHLTDHQLLRGLITLLVRQGVFSLDEIVTAAETSPEAPSVSMDKLLEISKRFDQ